MFSAVVDASALLTLLFREPGAERFARLAGARPAMSAVNWSEVVQKSAAFGVEGTRLAAGVRAAGLTILELTAVRAERVAALWTTTRAVGLSLADRACLGLALELESPTVTADRAWRHLALRDLELRLLR